MTLSQTITAAERLGTLCTSRRAFGLDLEVFDEKENLKLCGLSHVCIVGLCEISHSKA
jgi:hypothetical protein